MVGSKPLGCSRSKRIQILRMPWPPEGLEISHTQLHTVKCICFSDRPSLHCIFFSDLASRIWSKQQPKNQFPSPTRTAHNCHHISPSIRPMTNSRNCIKACAINHLAHLAQEHLQQLQCFCTLKFSISTPKFMELSPLLGVL